MDVIIYQNFKIASNFLSTLFSFESFQIYFKWKH